MENETFNTEHLIERFQFGAKYRNIVFGMIGIGIILTLTSFFFSGRLESQSDSHAATGNSSMQVESMSVYPVADIDPSDQDQDHGEDHSDQEGHGSAESHDQDHGNSENHESSHSSSGDHDESHADSHGGDHSDHHSDGHGGHHREIGMNNRAAANFLLNNMYFITLAMGALFFIAIHQIGNAGWHTAIKRVPEAMTAYLPVAIVGLAGVIFLLGQLYEWYILPEGTDELIDNKRAYLNQTGLILRNVVYFSVWLTAAFLLRRYSVREDTEGGLSFFKKSTSISAIFIFFFAFSYTLFAVDWMKSLEPHWFSTIYGVYVFAGSMLTSMAVLSLLLYFLKKQGYMNYVNDSHFQDVNTYVFGFCIFWAYIWIAQFLLIWYSNIPEEGIWYAKRMRAGDSANYMGYRFVFYLTLFINFVIPFLTLASRNARRNPNIYIPVCILVVIGHWLDLFILIMPGAVESFWKIGLMEIGFFLTFAGIFLYVVGTALTRANLVPLQHPYLEESLHHSTGPV
ncbi:MAG: quinol:cytochrome C oxidoreductase [Bacteroidota bacterium]